VVTLQIDYSEPIRFPAHKTLDDLSALRPAIHVVAQGYDCGCHPISVPNNRINGTIQKIQPAVKVGYGVRSAHGNLRQNRS
jgi:hypothetical protein